MKLEDLGYNDNIEQYRFEHKLEYCEIGRVISEHRERYIIKTINGEFEAEILIEDLSVDVGYLPPRVLGLVTEWASLHKTELLENWEIGRVGGVFKQIAPLI